MTVDRPGPTRIAPTSEFWRYLWFPAVFSVGALLLRQDLVFLLGALVVGCGAAALPLARANLAPIRVRRSLPPRGRVGSPLVSLLTVTNTGRRACVGLELEERVGRALRAPSPRLEVPLIAAGEQLTARTRLKPQRRGWISVRPPQVGSRFPLGVFRALQAPGPADEVLVRPREGRPSEALLRLLSGGGRLQAGRASRAPGHDDLADVREWRPGDDPRRIHPRLSARRGAAVATRWHDEQGPEAVLVLGPAEGAPAATIERAVSAVATVWRALGRLSRPARLLLGARTLRAPGGPGGLGPGLDALAEAAPPTAAELEAALTRLSSRPGGRTIVLVACGPAGRFAQALRRAAGPGGEALVLPAADPRVSGWLSGLER